MQFSDLSTNNILLINALVIGLCLLWAWVMLSHHGLFKWTTAGFWAWFAFLLYFVLTPLSVIISGDTELFDIRIDVAGGPERSLWILIVSFIGICFFFIAYLRTSLTEVSMGLSKTFSRITPLSGLVLLISIGIGMFSLLTYRAGLLAKGEVLIVSGRFVGGVTGYEDIGHVFIFVPTLLLILSEKRLINIIGSIMAGAYIFLSLPHGWSRYATLSMLLAITIVKVLKTKRKWPGIRWVVLILILGAVFQIRGHSTWTLSSSLNEFYDIAEKIPQQAINIFSGNDTAMLGTWYVESYLRDRYIGYDYGLPMINYLLTGWIPFRFFPDKYFLVDWLRGLQSNTYPPIIDNLLFGAKSSLIGSFYSNGGILAVIIEMLCAGWLSKKLDGMLSNNSPDLVKALGVAWMSVLWIVWGSGDYWGVMLFGTLMIPALGMWVFISKPRKRTSINSGLANEFMQTHSTL